MVENFKIADLPSPAEIAAAFSDAARLEPSTGHLQEAYRTGVMFDVDGHRENLDATCMGMLEGGILWYITRQLRPSLVIETGFGRGGSSAFFLSALSPWHGQLISIDPAFRHWAGDTGTTYLRQLGLSDQHILLDTPSEIALAMQLANKPAEKLKVAYIDGSHHFDGTLIDFVYLDRMLEVGGIIGIDDAHAPAVRTVASFVANNLPYTLHYATKRLVLCQKIAEIERQWDHFRPFTSSQKSDWAVHDDMPSLDEVPNATFGQGY